MKKSKKALLTAAILTSAVSFSSCQPSDDVTTVYGPPSAQEETTYDPASEKPQTEYGAPILEEDETTEPATNYDPSNDTPEEVYGPPSVEEDNAEITTTAINELSDGATIIYKNEKLVSADNFKTDSYIPEKDDVKNLYGPMTAY